MKAIAISGSPRQGGNTERLLKCCLDRLAKKGVKGELMLLKWKRIEPCRKCGDCGVTRDGACTIEDDFAVAFKAMRAADILVIGIPGDPGATSEQLKNLLQRAGQVSAANEHVFSRKTGGPIIVLRKEAASRSVARLLTWFLAQEFVMAGMPCGRKGAGLDAMAVTDDEAGEAAVERFADNLAWLAKLVEAGKESRPPA